ncbi:MAG: cupredoxin domain-containing protein [Actinomycetota bacterium]|nr:cupredoxin domain-containing protein [Actinomycetota bacterium]
MRAAALFLTGLAMLTGGCGSAAERTIELTIHHSRFDPATIEVSPGERVRFVIRNLDPIDHELIIGDAEVQRRHEDGTEPHHGVVPGEVSIPPVAERSTTYRFGEPGTLAFGCHLPGHWSYGMRGTVRVG